MLDRTWTKVWSDSAVQVMNVRSSTCRNVIAKYWIRSYGGCYKHSQMLANVHLCLQSHPFANVYVLGSRQKVFLCVPQKSKSLLTGKCAKLAPCYCGPFTVLRWYWFFCLDLTFGPSCKCGYMLRKLNMAEF